MDFFLGLGDTVRRLRVGCKGFGKPTRVFFLLRLDFFKECKKGLRIVPGLVHVLHAEIVGLSFETARECHKGQRQGESSGALKRISEAATHKNEWNRGKVGQLSP